ncbi:MAG: anthranilate phosphoribosyltransferase [Sphingomonadaceae bacterium]|uniref:anthranilate phosphoribosyltransferase n=1 Tax=Thermaurantiacus sp. TaxID=2820283 RepID=UPI00298EFAB5|nr:anthranilate phosphoribosyltransferase [Thermaurantiacus sp.]MCS6986520.1 anthranilate phosphoribosyltransferase [Sphingomonadaceae bacterium]MDW8414219.1 anthranilate phosphoribosyltransferase [Thermaurantiacus sp.]
MRVVLPDPARPLSAEEAEQAVGAALDGRVHDAELAAFLAGLSERGETAAEIAGAAKALRARMTPVTAPPGAIDVCGTGGDGAHGLNVSTAVAFVVAGAGVPVAKHGNRAASSRSGAADVLEALGADLTLPPDRLEVALHELGVAFLFAPRHHPALGRIAPVRRALGRRTLFNLVGPLANPARVQRQLVGVFHAGWLAPMAEAGRMLGVRALLVVHGAGLDELAVHAPSTLVWAGREGLGPLETLDARPLGLGPHPLAALRGGDAAHNARQLEALLAQPRDPALAAYRDIVLLNAAGALMVAGAAADWAEGVARARASLDDGAARDCLARFLAFR